MESNPGGGTRPDRAVPRPAPRGVTALLAALLVALAFTVTACGGGSDAATADSSSGDTANAAPVEGDSPAERAINGIKALGLPADHEINLFVDSDTAPGPKALEEEFERQSGVQLNIETAPYVGAEAKVFDDAITKAGRYDVLIVQPNRIADLAASGYVADIGPWVDRYDPELGDLVEPLASVQSTYQGETVAMPFDGDIFIFYYRKDLLEDPKEQKAFETQYGRELTVPETYEEYQEVLDFFTRPDEGLYGAVEWRAKGSNYTWFWQRLQSAGGSYFDDDMSAAINSPEGVQALQDMIDMKDNMPADSLGWGYIEGVEAMTDGSAFSNITWPAAGKAINAKGSETRGKWGYALVPGYGDAGSANHKSMSSPGKAFIVSDITENDKEAAYLYAQWFMSPENLLTVNQDPEGVIDPMRNSVFSNEEMRSAFPTAGAFLDSMKANLEVPVPDPMIPGYTEYVQALENELVAALAGQKSAQEALDTAADGWNQITASFGEDEQKQAYDAFLQSFGTDQ